MKTLLILRHAKSSWKHPELADHERPLNKRGQHDAPHLGTLLVDRELLPQLILSSTAVRTRQTADALIETSHYTGKVEYLDTLYMAEPPAYLKALRALPDDLERVLLIGHNPGLEGLLQLLSGQILSLPTAALAHLILPIQTWGSLTHETQGELVELFLPKPEEEPAKTEPEPKPKDQKPKEKTKMADKDKDKKKDEKLEKKDKKVKKDKKDKKDKKKDKK